MKSFLLLVLFTLFVRTLTEDPGTTEKEPRLPDTRFADADEHVNPDGVHDFSRADISNSPRKKWYTSNMDDDYASILSDIDSEETDEEEDDDDGALPIRRKPFQKAKPEDIHSFL